VRRHAGLAIALVGAASVPASRAHAERVGVVTVATPDAPASRTQLRDTSGLPDALAAAAVAITAGAVPASRLERFTTVRTLAESGWQAFLDVQPAVAAASLARARADAEALLVLDGGPELYADISLRLGVVLDHNGKTDEGADAIRLALALDPTRELSTRVFSPSALNVVAAARTLAPATRRARLAGATPSRSTVTIELDGAAPVPSPLTAELGLGHHVAIARAPGHAPRALAFTIDATSTTDLTIELDVAAELEAVSGGLAAGASDARATAAVDAALRYGDVDAVVVVATAWRGDQPSLFLQRCASTPIRCTEITELGYGADTGLAAALRTGIADISTEGARLATPTLVGDRRLTGGGKPKCLVCRPWVWAVGGGVVLAAAVLAIVLVDGDTGLVFDVDPNDTRPR
jgi:hypothetical protein